MTDRWTPDSWKDYPAQQQPDWPDTGALDVVLKRIAEFPSLVYAGESRALQSALGQVAEGRAFLLRGRVQGHRQGHRQTFGRQVLDAWDQAHR